LKRGSRKKRKLLRRSPAGKKKTGRNAGERITSNVSVLENYDEKI